MRRLAILLMSAGLGLAATPAAACPRGHQHPSIERYERSEAYGYEDEQTERGGYDLRRYDDDRYDEPGYDDGDYDAPYGERGYDEGPPVGASPWYIDGRHPAQACDCPPADAVQVSNSFFYDMGGVGPIPDGGWYGGTYVVGGYSRSSARSFASASSRASVSLHGGRDHGGYGKRGHGGKGR
jgi:hypothetical protein